MLPVLQRVLPRVLCGIAHLVLSDAEHRKQQRLKHTFTLLSLTVGALVTKTVAHVLLCPRGFAVVRRGGDVYRFAILHQSVKIPNIFSVEHHRIILE